jgi:predicted RNA binding protein YcfA (HicA-like mRNA interferase family)
VGLRSMKARELVRILEGLGYESTRQSGSHRRMTAEGRPPLTFAFHDSQTLPKGVVRKVLRRDVGLTDEEIDAVL